MKDKVKKDIFISLTILLSFAAVFFSVVGFVIFSFVNSINFGFPVYSIILFFTELIFVLAGIFLKKWNKIFLIVIGALFIICLGINTGMNYYKNKYIPSITVKAQTEWSSYQSDYLPFTDSTKLYSLKEESTLKFSENDELPVIDGATALLPVYCSFAQAVYPKNTKCWAEIRDGNPLIDYGNKPQAVIDYSNTVGAYKALINGERDIIFAAKPSKEQLQAAEEAGIEFNLTPIGYESFVFIVNSKNPVDSLTVSQIKDIFTGKITNWKEVGGKNMEIRPFQRDKNSGSQTAFLTFMGSDANILPPETHQVFGMDGLVDVVSDYQNHKNAIGYSFRYYIETMMNNPGVKMLALNGIEPTKENIQNKTYPFFDTFFAVTVKGRESENTKKFIEWILSEQGQEIVDNVGYVRLN